jgi:hypothetical protein
MGIFKPDLTVIIVGLAAIAVSVVLSVWVYGPLFTSYGQPDIGSAVSIDRIECSEGTTP